ncbi:MAG: phosphotransferase [Lautropia sp.]|nr:phosphotransferase [Lautropia sp.]
MPADTSLPTNDSRLDALRQWLATLPAHLEISPDSLTPASADASFRRYFRLKARLPNGQCSAIAMDAPPPQEDCRPFVHVARVFAEAGVSVPHIHAADVEQGFLLLDDLGNQTYLKHLEDTRTAPALYRDASVALVKLQAASKPGVFPAYDRELLLRELMLYPTWYVGRHKQITLTEAEQRLLHDGFELLLSNLLAQPAVYVHRDYHSRNLMVLADAARTPGVLDFQDAVYGPITYDLVSLLRDAYIHWEEADQLDWCIRHWERARAAGLPVAGDFGDFYRDFEWMGLQRHLKVLGIFARLHHRDGKDAYLDDIPLVARYAYGVLNRYQEFGPLRKLFERIEGVDATHGYTF